MLISSCSSVTILRTKEIKEATNSSAESINKRLDSLALIIDSIKVEQNKNLSRLKADFAELNSKVSDQNEQLEARMEELTFRLDRILTIVQKKSVVTKSGAAGKNSSEEQKNEEMEALYNASRSDYLKGEYVVAYNSFKHIYETLKTGETAENSLYWMGMCMLDAGKADNATTLFKSFLEKYPKSNKVCAVVFKLASIAEENDNSAEQKAWLQKLLGIEHCTESNEFHRAADILSR